MHALFARKLRLTATALGCTTRKALCARFRAANPATICDVDRLHKWMQGRAMPRGQHFFEDWRLVIRSERHPAWIETSSIEAFAEELAMGTGISLEDLWQREERQQRKGDAPPAILGAQRTLYGAFACYSHAWSPRHRGMLIRGTLLLEPGARHRVHATYVEALVTGTTRLSGDVILSGGMLHVLLKGEADGLPLFLSAIVPGPPASVLCGILAGPALIAHAALPSATRFVAVRAASGTGLEASNGYLEGSPPVLAEHLVAAGFDPPATGRVAAALLAFLGTTAHQVAVADQLALCDLLDGL